MFLLNNTPKQVCTISSRFLYNKFCVRFCHSSGKNVYERVMDSLPQDHVQMSFAYGSAVFQQHGTIDKSKNMLDFIIVVDNPVAWHKVNLKLNNSHYSFLKNFGPSGIAKIQELGAGVYFNTLVPFEDRTIKYGVISTYRLMNDLLNWSELYVAGRLHKPVKIIQPPKNEDLKTALDINLSSALNLSLLFLPEHTIPLDLYTMITQISYDGDVRMGFGEDKNKVFNIVNPNKEHFHKLYANAINQDENVEYNEESGDFKQNKDTKVTVERQQNLPKTILNQKIIKDKTVVKTVDVNTAKIYENAAKQQRINPVSMDELTERVKAEIDNARNAPYVEQDKQGIAMEAILKATANIVSSSSGKQTTVGVLMGGLKSIEYGWKKVLKWFQSSKKDS